MMIYTITVNPSLDYMLRLESLHHGSIQKALSEEFYPGGKGINVSNVLTQLAVPNVAMGFIAGFTGDEIERRVRMQGIKPDFVRLPVGSSRINVKIRTAEDLGETDINARGSKIDTASLKVFFEKLSLVTDGDILVLAGSIPESVPADIYETVIKTLSGKHVEFIVDATGDLLQNTLKYKPFLIKPNTEELGELFGVGIHEDNAIIYYARQLQQCGARNVLVSKGGEGAVLLCETGECYKASPVPGFVKSTVGAGDSMVAGFLAGWLKHHNYQQALVWGTAAGTATAFCEGIASGEDIREIIRQADLPEQIKINA